MRRGPQYEAIVERKLQPLCFLLTLHSAEYLQSRQCLFYGLNFLDKICQHLDYCLFFFMCMSRYSTLRQQHEHFKPTEILLEIDHMDIADYLAAQRI